MIFLFVPRQPGNDVRSIYIYISTEHRAAESWSNDEFIYNFNLVAQPRGVFWVS